jgi:hypothetical protein
VKIAIDPDKRIIAMLARGSEIRGFRKPQRLSLLDW